jgi:hypothetical protein
MGYEVSAWSLKRVKELLRELIKSKIIYEWDEAVLYSFLLRKGVLNIIGNRHELFFKNLVVAIRSKQGRKAIEDYSNSESEIPPDLSGFRSVDALEHPDEEVQPAMSMDEEAMQFYLDYSNDELWKAAFRDKTKAILAIKAEGKNGNKYHDTVVETFLSEYNGTQEVKIPEGYSFPSDPTLMQLYVAYKVKTLPYFANFSGTGAGKTLQTHLPWLL